jgi:SWI/SNF-related matrix-associated actin-dependent regulator of chromatin subfamily A member 5
MVVQQGRLKEKDKLSRDELLEAVRFGADKIFKSKDSSITDEDIDLIINAGKQKTQELNEKLRAADKGDLLDFKLTGDSNMQTFEGVDYSKNALAAAKAEAELLGILDVGKRERKQASYNETKLAQQAQEALKGQQSHERKKKKVIKLPKSLRLPRMEEWQMYNRARLLAIQEEEEAAFRALPEEVQKMATMKKQDVQLMEKTEVAEGEAAPVVAPAAEPALTETTEPDSEKSDSVTQTGGPAEPFELPPLISEEMQKEKEELLAEGFANWNRIQWTTFYKASGDYGRSNIAKIAAAVSKSEEETKAFADAFWGDIGKERISEHEYERVTNLIAKGERKIVENKELERGTRVLVSLFDNPWEELEFTYASVKDKDKRFSIENDRYLLCWTHKASSFFSFFQSNAVFLRTISVDQVFLVCSFHSTESDSGGLSKWPFDVVPNSDLTTI